jgi:hypothetical protein
VGEGNADVLKGEIVHEVSTLNYKGRVCCVGCIYALIMKIGKKVVRPLDYKEN